MVKWGNRFGWLAAAALAVIIGGCNSGTATEETTEKKSEETFVKINTNMGPIVARLYTDKAPVSTANFLDYVDTGFYKGTVFHRVIPGFMVQGGGYDSSMQAKQTKAPIKNEADNGVENKRGTLAMARGNDPQSATSQFFINLADNNFLNHQTNNPDAMGYAVFGEVVDGMPVVDKMSAVKTATAQGMNNVPVENLVIESIERIDSKTAAKEAAADAAKAVDAKAAEGAAATAEGAATTAQDAAATAQGAATTAEGAATTAQDAATAAQGAAANAQGAATNATSAASTATNAAATATTAATTATPAAAATTAVETAATTAAPAAAPANAVTNGVDAAKAAVQKADDATKAAVTGAEDAAKAAAPATTDTTKKDTVETVPAN